MVVDDRRSMRKYKPALRLLWILYDVRQVSQRCEPTLAAPTLVRRHALRARARAPRLLRLPRLSREANRNGGILLHTLTRLGPEANAKCLHMCISSSSR